MEDIGEFQGTKIFLILFYCLQAIWLRFRHGADNFYYVPAPGKRVALYRDWLVMAICRPFFKNVILHWHAAGLAKWLETSVQIRTRALTYRLFKPVDLSIVLSRYNVADAEKLLSRRVRVVNNGIPDPCPDFAGKIFPSRNDQTQTIIRVLFLAHCTREKGVFAAMEGVVAANRILAAQNSPLRMELSVAGNFAAASEKTEFDALMKRPEVAAVVKQLGFVSGARKKQALLEADVFCFPTCYLGENQPVNLIEAMAFGLPIVTTRWRSLPEMFPPNYPGLVSGQSPDEIAAALIKVALSEDGLALRENFLQQFSLESHLTRLAAALREVESPLPAPTWQTAAENF